MIRISSKKVIYLSGNLKIVTAMKKIFVLMAAMLVSVLSFAQADAAEQYGDEDMGKRILVNRWYQNWEASLKLGTQAYLSEYVLDVFDFGDWWNVPAFDLNISKWGTQSIGLDLGFTVSPMKFLYFGAPSSGESRYATFAKPDDAVYSGDFRMARGNMGNVYASVLLDVNNFLFGYKPDRIYHLVASVGGGIMFPVSKTQYRDVCASFNAGLVSKFNVTDHLSIDLAVRGTLHDDMFNGISYFTSDDTRNLSVDATIGATVGVSYRFDLPTKKTRARKAARQNSEGWTTVDDVVCYTDAYKEVETAAAEMGQTIIEKDAAVKEMAAAVAASDAAAREMAQTLEQYKADNFDYTQMVNFAIDKWEISNREKVIVKSIAETINSRPGTVFSLDGYADKQTSNPKHNQYLSERRVMAVYDMLVNEFGVNPEQLTKTAHGGVDYLFFNDAQCSRSVIVTAVR